MKFSEKEQLRRDYLKERGRLSSDVIDDSGRTIGEKLLNLAAIRSARKVALYSPIHKEVPTDLIFDHLVGNRRETYYPRVEQNGILSFLSVKNSCQLRSGKWGLKEPNGSCGISLHRLDAILVPGIVFDESGFRIGTGRGYYDRSLKDFGGIIIGLAYDFQVLQLIPHDRHDVRCQWIVTEERVIQCAPQ